MLDTIREAPLGQAIRWLSGSKWMRYPEEEDDFDFPKLVGAGCHRPDRLY